MKWLEIIELRSVGNNRILLEKLFQRLIEDLEKKGKRQTIKFYNHKAVHSDISIHLFHDSEEADINGSPLGLQLISTLKGYGLVNHNIWVEQTGV